MTAFRVAKLKDEYARLFEDLGRELSVSPQLRSRLHSYASHLYGFEECSDVNSVRYKLFKSGKYDENLLPPNQDSLDLHITRANYQCYIWRHAPHPVLDLPSFLQHGWEVDRYGNVCISWMTIGPAPESLLEFVNCKCQKGCENKRCSCVKKDLKCSELCKCTGCKNNEGADSEVTCVTFFTQNKFVEHFALKNLK